MSRFLLFNSKIDSENTYKNFESHSKKRLIKWLQQTQISNNLISNGQKILLLRCWEKRLLIDSTQVKVNNATECLNEAYFAWIRHEVENV